MDGLLVDLRDVLITVYFDFTYSGLHRCIVFFLSVASLLHYLAIQPSRLQGCSNKISCQSVVSFVRCFQPQWHYWPWWLHSACSFTADLIVSWLMFVEHLIQLRNVFVRSSVVWRLASMQCCGLLSSCAGQRKTVSASVSCSLLL